MLDAQMLVQRMYPCCFCMQGCREAGSPNDVTSYPLPALQAAFDLHETETQRPVKWQCLAVDSCWINPVPLVVGVPDIRLVLDQWQYVAVDIADNSQRFFFSQAFAAFGIGLVAEPANGLGRPIVACHRAV